MCVQKLTWIDTINFLAILCLTSCLAWTTDQRCFCNFSIHPPRGVFESLVLQSCLKSGIFRNFKTPSHTPNGCQILHLPGPRHDLLKMTGVPNHSTAIMPFSSNFGNNFDDDAYNMHLAHVWTQNRSSAFTMPWDRVMTSPWQACKRMRTVYADMVKSAMPPMPVRQQQEVQCKQHR